MIESKQYGCACMCVCTLEYKDILCLRGKNSISLKHCDLINILAVSETVRELYLSSLWNKYRDQLCSSTTVSAFLQRCYSCNIILE